MLEKHYGAMRKWNEFLGGCADNYIVNYSYYGDWASPLEEAVKGSQGDGAVSATTSGILMSTGYYYYNSILLSKMAAVLHRDEDARSFSELAEKIKRHSMKSFLILKREHMEVEVRLQTYFPSI